MTDQQDSGQPNAAPEQPSDENYQALTKHYVFNETGNILLCTTGSGTENLSVEFKSICAEVGVFFAAMTKAINSVTNPLTGKPYSIYNYKALKKVIDNSGLFVGVNRTTHTVVSDQAGHTFAQDLLQSLLGRKFGNTRLHFARGMFESIGKETRKLSSAVESLFGVKKSKAETSDSQSQAQSQAQQKHIQTSGNIFFICESLLGMPLISAVLVYIEPQNIEKPFDEITALDKARPDGQRVNRSYTFTKQTYLFVPPRMLKDYADDLNTGDLSAYQEFVEKLSAALRADVDSTTGPSVS